MRTKTVFPRTFESGGAAARTGPILGYEIIGEQLHDLNLHLFIGIGNFEFCYVCGPKSAMSTPLDSLWILA
jgi:hypothetical protein